MTSMAYFAEQALDLNKNVKKGWVFRLALVSGSWATPSPEVPSPK
jgi:hypothetical protein